MSYYTPAKIKGLFCYEVLTLTLISMLCPIDVAGRIYFFLSLYAPVGSQTLVSRVASYTRGEGLQSKVEVFLLPTQKPRV